MKVNLLSKWFDPAGNLWLSGVQDIPDELEDKLPSTAKIVKEEEPVKPTKKIDKL